MLGRSYVRKQRLCSIAGGMALLQVTLALLKPDLLARPLAVRTVTHTVLSEGFLVAQSRRAKLAEEDAKRFYAEHSERFFYDRLVSYMSSGPVMALVLARSDAVDYWRTLLGPTKSSVARAKAPHTLRGQFGLSDTRNSAHGSDSDESARQEISFFFPTFDLSCWYALEEPHFRAGHVHYCPKQSRHIITAAS